MDVGKVYGGAGGDFGLGTAADLFLAETFSDQSFF